MSAATECSIDVDPIGIGQQECEHFPHHHRLVVRAVTTFCHVKFPPGHFITAEATCS